MSNQTKDPQEELDTIDDSQVEAHSSYVPASGSGEDVRHQLTGMYQNWFLDYASYVILERAVPTWATVLNPCSAVSFTR